MVSFRLEELGLLLVGLSAVHSMHHFNTAREAGFREGSMLLHAQCLIWATAACLSDRCSCRYGLIEAAAVSSIVLCCTVRLALAVCMSLRSGSPSMPQQQMAPSPYRIALLD